MFQKSKIALVIAVVAGAAVFGPSFANAQPFWCDNASRPTHFTICNTPWLWRLDALQNYWFQAARVRLGPSGRRALQRSENAWLGRRNRCGRDVGCIAYMYRQRTAILRDLAN